MDTVTQTKEDDFDKAFSEFKSGAVAPKDDFDSAFDEVKASVDSARKPMSSLDVLDSKLRESEAKLFSAETSEADKEKARNVWRDTYVQRMKEYNPIERAGQYVPSAGEMVKGTGKALSGAQQTVEKLLPEYMENPVKAVIAGVAQVPRVLAETGRAAVNLGANIGEEAMSGISKIAGDDTYLRNSAEEALNRLELNKKFEDLAQKYTEKTYGAEKPSAAKLGEFVAGAALPLGGGGKAVKALETASEMGGKAALATAKAGTTAAKKTLQAGSAIAEAVIPKAAETKLVSGINDFIQNGAQPLLEKRILNLQKELARDIENIPMLGLTEEQGLARVSATADKIAASQNTLQNYISLSNFTKNASANAIKGIASTLTAAGLGGALGGSLAAATSEKPGDKEAALAGFGVGAATGGAVKGGAEALNTVGQAVRGAVSTIPIKPGDKINVSDLYDTAADVISGKKSGEPITTKDGEITFVADSSKNIMPKAPTEQQMADLLANSKYVQGTNAIFNPKINRGDLRYVSLVAETKMREIPEESRGARPLEAFAARQKNVERLPTDRVLSYAYHPEHGMIYAEFIPTVHDDLGGGRGLSHYVYDQITPEMGAKFESAPDKAAFIKSELEQNPNVRAIGIANNAVELRKAVELLRAGKLKFKPTGEIAEPIEVTPAASSGGESTGTTPATPSVAGAAKQTSKQVGQMFKEAESKIKESLPKTREDLMVELRAMNERMERQRDIDIENESIAAGKKQKADEAIAAEKQAADEAAAAAEKTKLSSIEKQNQSIIDQIVEKEGTNYENVVKARKNKTDQEWNQYLSERLGQADVVATRKAMLGEEQAKKSEIPRSFTTEEFNKRKVNALNEFKERNIPLNSDTEIAARVLAGTKDPREYNLILKNVTDLFVAKPEKPAKTTALKGFGELESKNFPDNPPESPAPVTPPPEPPPAGPSAGKPLASQATPEQIARANSTSRSGGAVGSKAVTPRYVQETSKPGEKILDFGAGKDAVHAKNLRDAGLDVTAHEFGANVKEGVHDASALDKSRSYDTVYASNVLNVQGDINMLKDTLGQIKGAVAKDGRAVFNYPSSPRVGKLETSEVSAAIKDVFGVEPKRVGGTKNEPIWEVKFGEKTPAVSETPVVSNPEVQVTKSNGKITLKPSEKLDAEVSQLATKKQMAAQKDYLTQNLAELEKVAPEVPELDNLKDREAYAQALKDKEYYSKGSGRAYARKVEQAEKILSSFNEEAPLVTIKVPGDGQYKIVNTKASLASFREKIESKFGTGLTVAKPANKKIPKMTEAERAEWQEK